MRLPRKDVTDQDRFHAINDLSIAIADVLSHLPVWGDWGDIKEYHSLMKDVRACWGLLEYILPRACPSQNREFNTVSDMIAEDIMRCIQPIMSKDVLDGEPYDWGRRAMWSEEEKRHFIQHAAEPFQELRKALRGHADSIMCAEITDLFEPWRDYYMERSG